MLKFSLAIVIFTVVLASNSVLAQRVWVKQIGSPPQIFEEFPVYRIDGETRGSRYYLVDAHVEITFPTIPKRVSFLNETEESISPEIAYASVKDGIEYKVFSKLLGNARSVTGLNELIDAYCGPLGSQLSETKFEYKGLPARILRGKISGRNMISRIFIDGNRLISLEVLGEQSSGASELDRFASEFFNSYIRRSDIDFKRSELYSDIGNGIYGNYSFNFSIRLPKEWVIWNDWFSLNLVNENELRLTNESERRARNLSQHKLIFIARPSNDITGIISKSKTVVRASSFKDNAPNVSLVKYSSDAIQAEKRILKDFETVEKPHSVNLKGNRYIYYLLKSSEDPTKVTFYGRYVARLNAKILSFEFIAVGEKELQDIKSYIETLKFYR